VGYYKDLREYIQVLEQNSSLVRFKREINKDTELMPLVRWQFRGLPSKDRKAFLFENVIDVKGKKYWGASLVGSHAASRKIYSLAMNCRPDEIMEKWQHAQQHPIKPKMVEEGPAQEEVHLGANLLEHGGLGEFAVPISSPGFDNAPYFSAGNCISRDPETGVRNVGDYRCMVKSPTRLGMGAQGQAHINRNWQKYKKQGIPMPVAISVGPTPNIGLVSVIEVPYGVDEFDVAGGIAGAPVELVKCKTVDLEVPATSEIVIEGFIPIDFLEREGPFGEYTGYMGMGGPRLFMEVTCITHRKNPIWNSYISQFPPSESSMITMVGNEARHTKHLKHELGIDNLVEFAAHEDSGGRQFYVISMANPTTPQVWQALYGASAMSIRHNKVIIAVDDDVDPRDMDSVVWALCYRMQPHRDIQVVVGKSAGLDPSAVPPAKAEAMHETPQTSTLLIDATRKWGYPPTSLPAREFMEKAKKIWEEEGLPSLTAKMPWYGSSLGYWPEEIAEEAKLALAGDHYKTGEKLAKNRIKT
jgi:4-hydroxy-3-polyprenylbenzoate decarboxylase